MPHSVLVLHFGGQCPWLPWVVDQARQAAAELGGTVAVRDVTGRPEIADKYGLSAPFLTIIDDRIRVSAPLRAATLTRLVNSPPVEDAGDGGADGPEESEAGGSAVEAQSERIDLLTAANSGDTCVLCNAPAGAGCSLKMDWLADREARTPTAALGYIAYAGGQPVAAVEVLPASDVPYPLRVAARDDAFITCIYPTRQPDYRGALLDRLLTDLPRQGYRRVLVVAGRRTPFPNGPASFFARRGFRELRDLGSMQLSDGDDRLVLMACGL